LKYWEVGKLKTKLGIRIPGNNIHQEFEILGTRKTENKLGIRIPGNNIHRESEISGT